MKTKLLLIVLATFFLCSGTTIKKNVETESQKHRILIKTFQDKLVVLRIDFVDGVKWLKYQFKIENERGIDIYYQNFMSKKPIYVGYNLSKMPEGKYIFTVMQKHKPVYTKKVMLGLPEKEKLKEEKSDEEKPIVVELIKN